MSFFCSNFAAIFVYIADMTNKIQYIACLCAVLFTLSAQAEPADCGTNLQWEIRNDSLLLTSPDSQESATMVATDFPWSNDSLTIKAIVLPDNLTNISVAAFKSFKAIEKVTLPGSVRLINGYAFYGCANLKLVTCLPMSPPTLDDADAFALCHNELRFCVPSLGNYMNADNWSLFQEQMDYCETPTDAEVVSAKEQPYKTMDDKHIIIIRNNEKYSIDGKKL